VEEDLLILSKRIRSDGGMGFWSAKDKKSDPFLSCHVGLCAALCAEKGFTVPDDFGRLKTYLSNIDRFFPTIFYTSFSKIQIKCYALYTLFRWNYNIDKLRKEAESMYRWKKDKLSVEGLAWLLCILGTSLRNTEDPSASTLHYVEEISKEFTKHSKETAETATIVTDVSEESQFLLLHSNRRTDALVLLALIDKDPKNKLIPKLTKGIVNGRDRHGRWLNTQENCWILLALDKYFQTYEKQEPEFVARIWLGDQFAGEAEFKGRSIDAQQINIPMSFLLEGPEEQPLIVEKQGKGRLYYRLAMNYAPENLELEAADYGFKVSRTYSPMENPDDVKLDKLGIWQVRLGAKLKVTVTMSNSARNFHVALIDKLPAGLEVINSAVKGTAAEEDDLKKDRIVWFDHQNLRDERVEAFTALLWPGSHVYSFVVRATTAGLFIIPPAKAEEMYAPDIFGRSKTERMLIL